MQCKTTSKPYVRKTMQLTGSARHSLLRLSFQALAAGRLTVLMLARASSPRPTLSAVARQALLDYAAKVQAMEPEERSREARRVSHASRAWLPDGEDRQRADAALAAADASEEVPLPSLAAATCSPKVDVRAMELRVNQLLKDAHPRRFAHLPTTDKELADAEGNA